MAGIGIWGSAANRLDNPKKIVFDSSDALYIADYDNHRVQKWAVGATAGSTVAGQADGTSGSTNTTLNRPSGIFLDSSNNLYVADTNNHRVQLWRNGSISGETVAGTGRLMKNDKEWL